MIVRRSTASNLLAVLAPLTLALAPSLGGCGRDDEDDAVSATSAASTVVEGSALAAYASSLVTASGGLSAGLTVDAAGASITASVQANLSAQLTIPSCATVTTDGVSFVEVAFAGCTAAGGLIALDGTIRAELSYETAPCGAAQCPTAVIYDLRTAGLTLGATTLQGHWTVRDALAPGVPSTFDGALDVDGPQHGASSTTHASFLLEGVCATVSLDATVSGAGGRSLHVTADGVTRCLGQCPTAGSVTVTGGGGRTWSWTYDGAGTATVTGPGGQLASVTLPCAP